MNEFNYKDSLNGIKASLFDIYEDQEQEIGLEQNPEKRHARLNKFIEVKDIALTLIEAIQYLYEEKENNTTIVKNKLENPKIPDKKEESKILDMVENSNTENIEEDSNISSDFNEEEISQEDVDENYEEDEEITFENQEDEKISENSDEQEENDENTDDIDNQEEINYDEENSVQLKKYYLDCDIKDVNFAYVPQSLYEKIKNFSPTSLSEEGIEDDNSMTEENDEMESEEEAENTRYIKQDSEKPRGIIVRSDQYMKLALSKHRQEGVLQEARKYRVEEVKRRRKEEQKRELEKAEVKIDI